MTLTRKHAVVLWGIAVWNLVTYVNFAQNLYNAHSAGEDRPTGYWVAHTVLIVVNLLIAGLLAEWGRRVWRSQVA